MSGRVGIRGAWWVKRMGKARGKDPGRWRSREEEEKGGVGLEMGFSWGSQ